MQMTLFAFGLNHESAPLDLRERFALDEELTRRFYAEVASRLEEPDLVLLSTCNRTEVYGHGTAESKSTTRLLE